MHPSPCMKLHLPDCRRLFERSVRAWKIALLCLDYLHRSADLLQPVVEKELLLITMEMLLLALLPATIPTMKEPERRIQSPTSMLQTGLRKTKAPSLKIMI